MALDHSKPLGSLIALPPELQNKILSYLLNDDAAVTFSYCYETEAFTTTFRADVAILRCSRLLHMDGSKILDNATTAAHITNGLKIDYVDLAVDLNDEDEIDIIFERPFYTTQMVTGFLRKYGECVTSIRTKWVSGFAPVLRRTPNIKVISAYYDWEIFVLGEPDSNTDHVEWVKTSYAQGEMNIDEYLSDRFECWLEGHGDGHALVSEEWDTLVRQRFGRERFFEVRAEVNYDISGIGYLTAIFSLDVKPCSVISKEWTYLDKDYLNLGHEAEPLLTEG